MARLGLELRIARKSFRDAAGAERCVLGRIELAVEPGEVVALVGPSGCGKTTVMRIAGGLDTGFAGTRTWHGPTSPRIGTVFQEPRLLAWRTVRQNVLLAQPAPDPDLADRLLDRLGLAPFAQAWPGTLSLGMARRVAVARALSVRPDLLLLDEPFASLDAAMTGLVHALLAETWAARPIATILVTHDRAEAAALAHRVVVLGGSPAEVVG